MTLGSRGAHSWMSPCPTKAFNLPPGSQVMAPYGSNATTADLTTSFANAVVRDFGSMANMTTLVSLGDEQGRVDGVRPRHGGGDKRFTPLAVVT
jgi:hypothetical protein